MGQTIVEKIAQAHMTTGPKNRLLKAGDFVTIRPAHVLTHDNTSAVLKKFASMGGTQVFDPTQPVFVLDHDIQNQGEANQKKYATIECFAKKQGIAFYGPASGIGHQMMCEELFARPGAFVVASDSHANTYGALSCLGTPVVRTDAACIWATGEFWWQIPGTFKVVLKGKMQPGVTGKDVILALCSALPDTVLNHALEFAGPGIKQLNMDERMTIANMTTEWGALVGWFPTDSTTLRFIEKQHARLVRAIPDADASLSSLKKNPPQPDTDACYAGQITLDLFTVTPFVAGPDTVQNAAALSELETKHIQVHKAYLLSCVNSRLTDLETAATVLRHKKVASHVEFYVAAASKSVQKEAEQSGAWQTLEKAGARMLPPSCGPCIGLGQGLLEDNQVGISSTNRNFKGRMGSRNAACYLASPMVVAASAAAGHITGPVSYPKATVATHLERTPPPKLTEETIDILPGFPKEKQGRLVYVVQDNLNTDGIYGKDFTYRDDMTQEKMAEVVMHNYDPSFANRTRAGDMLVGGFNFGTGSSREQAATALMAKGFEMVIAGSFSQTYLRNALNNGFACVTCPTLVQRLKSHFETSLQQKEKTVVSEEILSVNFSTANIKFLGETFSFDPLSLVPQSLIVAKGIENQIRDKLST